MIRSVEQFEMFSSSIAKGMVATFCGYLIALSVVSSPANQFQIYAAYGAVISVVFLSAYFVIEALKLKMGIKAGCVEAFFPIGFTSSIITFACMVSAINHKLGLVFWVSFMAVFGSLIFFVKSGPAPSYEEINKVKKNTSAVGTLDEYSRNDGGSVLVVIGILAALAIVVALWIYFGNFSGPLPDDRGKWGEFGDYLGGTLGPVMAFLALVALLYTIKIQSRELARSTKQLEQTALAMSEQNSLWKKESFENTFFRLLAGYEGICRKYEEQLIFEKLNGSWREELERFSELISPRPGSGPLESRRDVINNAIPYFLGKNRLVLEKYFSSLCNLLIFFDGAVRDRAINKNDEVSYLNIIKSSMTDGELFVVFYFIVGSNQAKGKMFFFYENILRISKKYKLLTYIKIHDLVNKELDTEILDQEELRWATT